MKLKVAFLAVLSCLVLSSVPTLASTLTLVSTGGEVVGGVYVYPYNFSVNSASSLTSLMCLDFNREISSNETWNVSVGTIPLDNSQASIDYRADAWIFSQLGTRSDSDVQYAAWSIFDLPGVQDNVGFDATAQSLAQTGLAMAQNQSLISSGFFSSFSLYVPTSDSTGWTNGLPQRFIGTAVTPEPASLVLLGTGLVGLAGSLRRRVLRAS